MQLEDDAVKLLQSMKRTDGRKYTSGPINRSRYIKLERQGLIKGERVNASDIIYTLLPEGELQLAS